jgi:hypothetical protein
MEDKKLAMIVVTWKNCTILINGYPLNWFVVLLTYKYRVHLPFSRFQ